MCGHFDPLKVDVNKSAVLVVSKSEDEKRQMSHPPSVSYHKDQQRARRSRIVTQFGQMEQKNVMAYIESATGR